MAKLLVLGAGYVGQEILRLGARAGDTCFAVSRSASSNLKGVRSLTADVTDPGSLSTLHQEIGDVDDIVYAIAPGAAVEEAYERTYVIGLSRALAEFQGARLFLISTTRVYGSRSGELIDDKTEALSDDACGELILEGEKLVRGESARNVILRASGIYGPGRTRLAESLLSQELPVELQGTITNRIHRDDLAGLVSFLRSRDDAGTFVASDPNPAALGEMQRELKSLQERLAFTPERQESTRTRRSKSRRVLPTRLLALGYDFLYPSFREGYASIFRRRASA